MIEDIIMICGLAIIVSLIIGFLYAGMVLGQHLANAQDADPAGYCLYKYYPYIQMCEDQKLLDFLEQFNNWSESR